MVYGVKFVKFLTVLKIYFPKVFRLVRIYSFDNSNLITELRFTIFAKRLLLSITEFSPSRALGNIAIETTYF